jgi:hypothetical protein
VEEEEEEGGSLEEEKRHLFCLGPPGAGKEFGFFRKEDRLGRVTFSGKAGKNTKHTKQTKQTE